MRGETIELTVEIVHETEKAVLFTDGTAEKWVPRSQIQAMESTRNGAWQVTLPEWLAKKNGWI